MIMACGLLFEEVISRIFCISSLYMIPTGDIPEAEQERAEVDGEAEGEGNDADAEGENDDVLFGDRMGGDHGAKGGRLLKGKWEVELLRLAVVMMEVMRWG